MNLLDVKTVKEELIEDMANDLINEGLLYGYDFSNKLKGVRDLMFLVRLTHIKNEEEHPFSLIQDKLDEIETSAHCYIKYSICLMGTSRTLWERNTCEILDRKKKPKKVTIEELGLDKETKRHELRYRDTDNLGQVTTVGGKGIFLALVGKEKVSEIMKEDPVSEIKFKPEGEIEYFEFKGYKQHLVSQNHLIEEGKYVRVRKDGKEHILEYRGYALSTEKLTFKEGELVHYISLKSFDKCEILEVL